MITLTHLLSWALLSLFGTAFLQWPALGRWMAWAGLWQAFNPIQPWYIAFGQVIAGFLVLEGVWRLGRKEGASA